MDNSDTSPQFAMLWADVQRSVFAFILAACPDFGEAEDLLQKTAMAAFSKISDYDTDRLFLAWVIGFARIEVMRYLRATSRQRVQYVSDALDELATTVVSELVKTDQRSIALKVCLEKVDGRARKVLDLFYQSNLSLMEIADQLNLTVANVKVILHRSRNAIQECIEQNIERGDYR